jgi:PAS domain S-box-containing protein
MHDETPGVAALARLNELSARLWRIRDLHEGLREIVVAVRALLGTDKSNIQLLDPSRGVLTIAAQSGFDQPFLEFFREVSIDDPSGCGRAWSTGRPVVIADIEADAAYAPLRSIARAAGYRSVVSTPLLNSTGTVIGMLSTHAQVAYQPTEESMQYLDLYARQAAGFIERCQMQQARQDSEERFRLMANAVPVLIFMSASDHQCTYVNQRWLDFTGQSWDEAVAGSWLLRVHPRDAKEYRQTYQRAADRRSPLAKEYRLVRRDGEYRWIFDQRVPRFNADGSFAGYLHAGIDVTDRKLAETALSRVSRRLIEAQESERSRIARELHDDIAQKLAVLTVNVTRLKEPFLAWDKWQHAIDQIGNEIAEIMKDVQQLSHGLHSPKLALLGLTGTAASFCREFANQQKVEIDFHHENVPDALPEEVSLCLFRVMQEALQNAIKHSESKHYQVWLKGGPDEVSLAIHDSGVGFQPDEAVKGPGLGLISMKERLRLVDGELTIDSRPLGGTVVHARVPVQVGTRSAMLGT